MKTGLKILITIMTFSMLISSSWARKEKFRCEEIYQDTTIPLDAGCNPGDSTVGGPCGTGKWVLFKQSGKGRNKRWDQHGTYEGETACETAATN